VVGWNKVDNGHDYIAYVALCHWFAPFKTYKTTSHSPLVSVCTSCEILFVAVETRIVLCLGFVMFGDRSYQEYGISMKC